MPVVLDSALSEMSANGADAIGWASFKPQSEAREAYLR
jgi:hypothetical protein